MLPSLAQSSIVLLVADEDEIQLRQALAEILQAIQQEATYRTQEEITVITVLSMVIGGDSFYGLSKMFKHINPSFI